ncbi:ABC transporter substrate-binding protein [Bacillus alkalicellulosilyticus]|uniref:ABC transporter substrate-binding protein n=1 Tax=Alkalihalobacterium alkalicellulosilyticum TaxID=1912214 RepID=UPI000997383C|nr:iron-siderophore ABC transporter substrate-binding protein [Bacillus alkalicellulosilyticus]
MSKKMFSVSNLAIVFAILLAMMFIATGCGSTDSNAPVEETPEETQEEQQEEVSNNDSREIVHAMGTTVVEGTPQRIVTLYQGATDAAVAFGVTPVGAVQSWVEQPFYEYLRDDLEGTVDLGEENQPNLEEIAKLKPDLIIASQMRHEEIYDQLTAIAPTVTHETVFVFEETVELMGKAMNKEEEANQLLADWDARVADFQTKAQETLGDEWPLNVSILNFRADHARIYFTGFAGSILADLGFTRPENQQSEEWGIILEDKEAITEMNADIFYIFNEDDPAVEQTFEEWKAHPLWATLDAVNNDQVYMVDAVTWNMAGGIIAANLMLDDVYDRLGLEK